MSNLRYLRKPGRLAAGFLCLSLLAASARAGDEVTIQAHNDQPAVDLCGSWSGQWTDCKSGHHGPLRAEFCKCGCDHYRVTFTGRFFKVFPFRYTVVLNVVGREGNKVLLQGQNNLGPLFGTFTYQAEATPCDFVAHYSSCRYQGEFVLKRCQ